MGMNTPPKKTIATRMRVAGGIASGTSRKGAEMHIPKAEKVKAESTTPKAKRNGFAIAAPGSSRTITMYPADRTVPKKNPANALPTIMVVSEIGATSSLSKVPLALSKGNARDSIAPAPKSEDIATIPGIIEDTAVVLPTEKAK